MKKGFVIASIVAGGLLAGGAACAQDSDIGKSLFTEYCAACHGESAKGDGSMAQYLTIKPADLTVLAQKNDGKFPMLDVIQIIDGRTGVRAHGGPMPVFGEVFTAQSSSAMYGSIIETRGRILSLALYLETLQQ